MSEVTPYQIPEISESVIEPIGGEEHGRIFRWSPQTSRAEHLEVVELQPPSLPDALDEQGFVRLVRRVQDPWFAYLVLFLTGDEPDAVRMGMALSSATARALARELDTLADILDASWEETTK